VLLCHGQVRLMDFGQAVQTHSSGGIPLRYFSALGKPPYRPPECYVPLPRTVEVLVPSDARMGEVTFAKTASGGHLCDVRLPPSATPGQTCTAEPSGYLVPPVDVFACGVCLFMMITGMPPWKLAILSDSHFQFVKANGILKLLHAWKKLTPLVADELLALMLRFDPAKRPSAEQCLSHLWFKPLSGSEVPLHRSSPPASPTPSPCRSDSQTSFCSASSESPPEPTVAQVEKLGSSACASPQRGKTAVDDATLRMSCGDFYSDPEPPVHRGFESFLQASPPTCAPPTHRRHGRSCPRVRRSALGSTLKMSAACAETSAGEAPELYLLARRSPLLAQLFALFAYARNLLLRGLIPIAARTSREACPTQRTEGRVALSVRQVQFSQRCSGRANASLLEWLLRAN
jgi:serine/threonine protein kinase